MEDTNIQKDGTTDSDSYFGDTDGLNDDNSLLDDLGLDQDDEE